MATEQHLGDDPKARGSALEGNAPGLVSLLASIRDCEVPPQC